jgi:P-type E1-E2 ATPase
LSLRAKRAALKQQQPVEKVDPLHRNRNTNTSEMDAPLIISADTLSLGSAYGDLDESSSAGLTPETIERDLVFVGLAGMYDPPRAEAKAAVAKCRAAGIRVAMITGNHPHTATAYCASAASLSEQRIKPTGGFSSKTQQKWASNEGLRP